MWGPAGAAVRVEFIRWRTGRWAARIETIGRRTGAKVVGAVTAGWRAASVERLPAAAVDPLLFDDRVHLSALSGRERECLDDLGAAKDKRRALLARNLLQS